MHIPQVAEFCCIWTHDYYDTCTRLVRQYLMEVCICPFLQSCVQNPVPCIKST